MEARADVLQCVESVSGVLSRWRATAEQRRKKGNFSPVEGFDSLHWVIVIGRSEGQSLGFGGLRYWGGFGGVWGRGLGGMSKRGRIRTHSERTKNAFHIGFYAVLYTNHFRKPTKKGQAFYECPLPKAL